MLFCVDYVSTLRRICTTNCFTIHTLMIQFQCEDRQIDDFDFLDHNVLFVARDVIDLGGEPDVPTRSQLCMGQLRGMFLPFRITITYLSLQKESL